MRALISSHPGWEATLRAEVERAAPKGRHAVLGPGWVFAETLTGRAPALAFATQIMPEPYAVQAASINLWAEILGTWICDTLREHTGPWRLHTYFHDLPGGRLRAGRVALIERGVRRFLGKKQRRLLRTYQPEDAPLHPEEYLLQAAWTDPDAGWVSVAEPDTMHRLRHIISPFAGGVPHIPEDKRPPARAYLKFCEAQVHMARRCRHDETVVDLGAAPGSWSFVALQQGARVTAIDRSALRDDMMQHRRLAFVTGDAFKYRPKMPVDWLICDVIAYPERSIALLEQWLAAGLCKYFVVTLKFRGEDNYGVVDACKQMLQKHAGLWGLRVLRHNKNEACAYGER